MNLLRACSYSGDLSLWGSDDHAISETNFLKPVIRKTRTFFLKSTSAGKNYLISKIHLDNSKQKLNSCVKNVRIFIILEASAPWVNEDYWVDCTTLKMEEDQYGSEGSARHRSNHFINMIMAPIYGRRQTINY